jgi:hypothetical protein
MTASVTVLIADNGQHYQCIINQLYVHWQHLRAYHRCLSFPQPITGLVSPNQGIRKSARTLLDVLPHPAPPCAGSAA